MRLRGSGVLLTSQAWNDQDIQVVGMRAVDGGELESIDRM